jgi:hypothetical protein
VAFQGPKGLIANRSLRSGGFVSAAKIAVDGGYNSLTNLFLADRTWAHGAAIVTDPNDISDDEIQKRRNARVLCFVDENEIEAFDRAYVTMMRELHKRRISMYVNEDNVLHYSHGANWIRSAREDDEGLQMETLSTEWSTPHQSILENDLSLITTSLRDAVESLSAQFARSIYGVVDAAAERVGNIVSDLETGSTAKSFLEMLKKIEFGVDRDGNVSLPSMHVGPGMAEKLLNELESQPPEFSEEVERIKAERTELALKKEAERKAKFKAAT